VISAVRELLGAALKRKKRSAHLFNRSMVIAMIPMRMVQMSVHEEIGMAGVRDSRMAAIGTVLVTWIVRSAVVLRGATLWIDRAGLDFVFIDVIAMRMVQMAIVQVIDMVVVTNGGMPAVGAVLVGMIFVNLMLHNRVPFRAIYHSSPGMKRKNHLTSSVLAS
jgi:hypothetical protein